MVRSMTAPSALRARRLAWGTWLFSVALLAAALVLLALDWPAIDSLGTGQALFLVEAAIVGVLGVLIATRRPGNPIGWLLLAIALAEGEYVVATFAGIRGQLSGVSPHGWVQVPAAVVNSTAGFGIFFLGFVILLFPDGRLLPGPRWRSAAWVAGFVVVAMIATTVLAVAPIQLSPRLPSVPNPLAVQALDSFTNSGAWPGAVGSFSLFVLLVVAVVVRFRRSRDDERRQLRWFAYVAGAGLVLLLASFPISGLPIGTVTSDVAGVCLTVLVPATIGLAVMRHGLYDIDVFMSRSIVYGSLAVFITAVYVGIAVGIGALVGSGGKPNLGLSILATAIVAVGFQPVRERVQRVANRLVYGKRATPYEVLSQFSERVSESYASDDVLPRMARVLAEGTAAERAEVWLGTGESLRRVAAFPLDGSEPASPDRIAADPTPATGAARSVDVRHQGEVLGALTVTKRRGEQLTPIETKLMDDLAHQAGLVLKNVGLTADLQARLVELRASRQRLVAAQDGERRKLERNLHDGAQQHLVAIKVKLGLAQMLATKDPEKARATLAALKNDADDALETVRDLARGIYPPLLAEKGLAAALRSQAGKATVPVTVDAEGVNRHNQDTEAALYFCTLEALQNVQKYAVASAVVVRVRENAARVEVEVSDDGRGFDVTSMTRGAGLTNMEDRLDALGGTLEIVSTPGAGTTLRASIPTRAVPPASVIDARVHQSAGVPA
jgi:signal transduction histidine kinase